MAPRKPTRGGRTTGLVIATVVLATVLVGALVAVGFASSSRRRRRRHHHHQHESQTPTPAAVVPTMTMTPAARALLAGHEHYVASTLALDLARTPEPRAQILVSYSLYGSADCYNYGMLENALMVPEFYPGARVRVHAQTLTCQPGILRALRALPHVEVVDVPGTRPDSTLMMARFEPAFEAAPHEIVLVRDADSRITDREVAAVQDWLQGSRDFHAMRDHQLHAFEVLGGMWGARRSVLVPLRERFRAWKRRDHWGADQEFLRDVVYPCVRDAGQLQVHASFHQARFEPDRPAAPFPHAGDFRDGPDPDDPEKRVAHGGFVGEVRCSAATAPRALLFLGESLSEGRHMDRTANKC